ncbi:hypothetical protein SS50377_23247 [Spironucleus salmonicida]|uniref:Ribonuclease P protein component 1 n=1 Tax=Spironucleus salmonicida TaxID=348837 RepID=V6LHM4_9EUKA|nr:hypothetical protein SS50377_23247 [Spironucleus salmonicida]|eukprot:EST44075.1 Ribonuclease P protein component 1 [Spironucleus salmonicida]
MTGVSYQVKQQQSEVLQQNLSVSDDFIKKIISSTMVQAGSNKSSIKNKKLLDFKINTSLFEISKQDADKLAELFQRIKQTPSQFMELTGAKIQILRSKIPGLVGISGRIYQETPTHLAIFCDNRCMFILKKQIDWVHDNIYFVGTARSQRYKKMKKFSL